MHDETLHNETVQHETTEAIAPDYQRDLAAYREYPQGQVRELLTRYGRIDAL